MVRRLFISSHLTIEDVTQQFLDSFYLADWESGPEADCFIIVVLVLKQLDSSEYPGFLFWCCSCCHCCCCLM